MANSLTGERATTHLWLRAIEMQSVLPAAAGCWSVTKENGPRRIGACRRRPAGRRSSHKQNNRPRDSLVTAINDPPIHYAVRPANCSPGDKAHCPPLRYWSSTRPSGERCSAKSTTIAPERRSNVTRLNCAPLIKPRSSGRIFLSSSRCPIFLYSSSRRSIALRRHRCEDDGSPN